MSVTIKVSGISEELLAELDKRVLENHMTSRSEYIRQVLREVLSQRATQDAAATIEARQRNLAEYLSTRRTANLPPDSNTWSREVIYED